MFGYLLAAVFSWIPAPPTPHGGAPASPMCGAVLCWRLPYAMQAAFLFPLVMGFMYVVLRLVSGVVSGYL